MKSLSRVFGYPVAFAAGFFMFWFSETMQSGIPRSGRSLTHPQIVERITIIPEQRWILDYEISATSLDVDSKREYVLLLLTPLGENSQPPTLNGYAAQFELLGLADPETSLVFRLAPGKIKSGPGSQYMDLMELTGNLSHTKRIELSDVLELKAQELSFDERSKGTSYIFEGKKWHQI